MTDDAFFEALRREEFAHLDRSGIAYLDYAGSGVFAESQIRAHHDRLLAGLYGNPHSEHLPSRASGDAMDAAREAVLEHFGVSAATHGVCFTANASAAVKLVAESFPFSPGRGLLLTADNHNSVNGIREFAARADASVSHIPLDDELRIAAGAGTFDREPGLFAFPAQSNFSGVKHPLSLVAHARKAGWRVFLDAASFAPTGALDLSACEADFACVSFYKMFGYPTGIGALICRHDALDELRRPWFAGGTVDYVSVQHRRHRLRRGHEGFEDGTVNFLAASALPSGFDLLARVGNARLAQRVTTLTDRLLGGLGGLRHDTGAPAIEIYGPADAATRGGIVSFNVIDRAGVALPYWTVEAAARDAGLALRGGCFCNPGAAEAAFRFDADNTQRCLSALGSDFTIPAFASCLGASAVVGALRISVGLPTIEADLDLALEFLREFIKSAFREVRVGHVSEWDPALRDV